MLSLYRKELPMNLYDVAGSGVRRSDCSRKRIRDLEIVQRYLSSQIHGFKASVGGLEFLFVLLLDKLSLLLALFILILIVLGI